MKLLFAPPSPYSRKVRVLARELGLTSSITEVSVHTTPLAPAAEVTQANPLSKIPTLVMEDGSVLYDSGVICEYMVHLAADRAVANRPGNAEEPANRQNGERWSMARRHALADGILDAGLAHRYETVLRPQELHWEMWLQAQRGKIVSGIARMATDLPDISGPVGVDAIAIACTLGWIEFRMPDIDWRSTHPRLAIFFDAMASRASMVETQP